MNLLEGGLLDAGVLREPATTLEALPIDAGPFPSLEEAAACIAASSSPTELSMPPQDAMMGLSLARFDSSDSKEIRSLQLLSLIAK